MLRLTIAVHNKAGLYVHRGSLVANVPGGRREQLGGRRQTFVTFQQEATTEEISDIITRLVG